MLCVNCFTKQVTDRKNWCRPGAEAEEEHKLAGEPAEPPLRMPASGAGDEPEGKAAATEPTVDP